MKKTNIGWRDWRDLVRNLYHYYCRFLAYGFLAVGEQLAAAAIGASEIIGFWQAAVFILLATLDIGARDYHSATFVAGGEICRPADCGINMHSVCMMILRFWLDGNGITLGNISFTYLAIVRGVNLWRDYILVGKLVEPFIHNLISANRICAHQHVN